MIKQWLFIRDKPSEVPDGRQTALEQVRGTRALKISRRKEE
jgi:hypothetical protein